MPYKDDLKEKATQLGIPTKGTENIETLETLIGQSIGTVPVVSATPTAPSQEVMVPISQVKELIREAMAAQAEKDKPVKVKKVTEHHAHVFRLNGKWVVDFANRNYDYENKKIIDPYIKEKIHAYQVYNPQKREFEAWIKLIFQNGTMEEIPLNRYIERRTLIYCKINKREKVDASYVIGEVDKQKEVGDMMKPSGVMIDQEVTMHREIFHVITPDGEELILPEHVIC